MPWWVRGRGLLWVLVTGVVSTILAALAGGATVALPDFIGGRHYFMPVAALTPLLPATALAISLGRQDVGRELLAVRNTWAFDVIVVMFVIILHGPLLVLPNWAGGQVLRNCAGWFGLVLLCHARSLPVLAALMPTLYTVFTGCFGHDFSTAVLWGWPAREPRWATLVVPVFFLVAGVWLYLRRYRPRRHAEEL